MTSFRTRPGTFFEESLRANSLKDVLSIFWRNISSPCKQLEGSRLPFPAGNNHCHPSVYIGNGIGKTANRGEIDGQTMSASIWCLKLDFPQLKLHLMYLPLPPDLSVPDGASFGHVVHPSALSLSFSLWKLKPVSVKFASVLVRWVNMCAGCKGGYLKWKTASTAWDRVI